MEGITFSIPPRPKAWVPGERRLASEIGDIYSHLDSNWAYTDLLDKYKLIPWWPIYLKPTAGGRHCEWCGLQMKHCANSQLHLVYRVGSFDKVAGISITWSQEEGERKIHSDRTRKSKEGQPQIWFVHFPLVCLFPRTAILQRWHSVGLTKPVVLGDTRKSFRGKKKKKAGVSIQKDRA